MTALVGRCGGACVRAAVARRERPGAAGPAVAGSLVVGVYYSLPDQGEPFDEAFLLQLQEASSLQALILLGDFNHPDVCWKMSTASCRQSKRLLECLDDNFLTQKPDSPTQGEAILDLMVTNVSEFIRDVKIGGSLGCSDHALLQFTVLRCMSHMRSTVRTLNFRKTKFQLFKELVNRTPWETALKDKGAEQSWLIFKEAFHRAQELSIPRCKKLGKEGKRPAWLLRPAGQSKRQDGTPRAVEAGTGILGRVQGRCLVV
ncbi:uncharacterized protein O3Q21_008449 [Podargus strigoides]